MASGMRFPASLAAVLGLAAPVAVVADEDLTHIASNGAIVPMPDIESLDCPDMASVIQRIDASGYRDPDAPEPAEGHPDRSIFEYENALTAQEYFECTLGRSQGTDPGLAFDKD